MCLRVDINKTSKAKENKTGRIVRWKVVNLLHSKNILFNYLHSIFERHEWVPGWNKSDRIHGAILSKYEAQRGVYCGIHVLTSRKQARSWYYWNWNWNCGYRALKVICYNKDLIAIGKNNDAVYTKVFVPQDEYNDAIKRKNAERRK